MRVFAWLEETGMSIWLRESSWGFFFLLVLHSLAMGVVVGINLALALRLLGVAARVPAHLMLRFFPVMWYGVVAVLLSGLLLLLAYPAKALTNWVFYLKLACILGGLGLARHFSRQLNTLAAVGVESALRRLALLSLLLWVVAITAGRFLAYTHTVLLASRFY